MTITVNKFVSSDLVECHSIKNYSVEYDDSRLTLYLILSDDSLLEITTTDVLKLFKSLDIND